MRSDIKKLKKIYTQVFPDKQANIYFWMIFSFNLIKNLKRQIRQTMLQIATALVYN